MLLWMSLKSYKCNNLCVCVVVLLSINCVIFLIYDLLTISRKNNLFELKISIFLIKTCRNKFCRKTTRTAPTVQKQNKRWQFRFLDALKFSCTIANVKVGGAVTSQKRAFRGSDSQVSEHFDGKSCNFIIVESSKSRKSSSTHCKQKFQRKQRTSAAMVLHELF